MTTPWDPSVLSRLRGVLKFVLLLPFAVSFFIAGLYSIFFTLWFFEMAWEWVNGPGFPCP